MGMNTTGWVRKILIAVMYLLAVFMVIIGLETALTPLEPRGGELGFIFGNRVPLVMFGLWFSSSGAALFYGNLKKRRRVVSWSLMSIYLSFLFGAVISGVASDWHILAWLPNFIASLSVGALWLWWRMKTEYIDLKEIRELRKSLKGYK